LPFAFLALAAPASAQVPRAPVLADFGQCIARQAGGVARALLETEMGSQEEIQRARQIFNANPACIHDRRGLSARVGEVRGIVAEAMLEADAAAVARLSASPPGAVARASGQLDGRAFVAAYAACLADAEPRQSIALLATAHHSPEEVTAFLAYGEALSDCMPEGATYRIDRFDVRNHIAARLYRTAMIGEEAR
jgi:hypothetical protein